MDTWHDRLGNINHFGKQNVKVGYTEEEFRAQIQQGRSEDMVFHSEETGEFFYCLDSGGSPANWICPIFVAIGRKRKIRKFFSTPLQTGAQNAIDKIKDAINSVSSTRGTLGATQNRLEHTKNNILLQSVQAMLAQSNQLPQGVLQLLG